MSNPFKGRTNQKLGFAQLHLEEITSRPEMGSADNFEVAHEESFLFHLIGAKDSFLQEINDACGLGLSTHCVTAKNLKEELKKARRRSRALARITKLQERSKASWLAIATELRNQGAHRSRAKRHFVRGASSDNFFIDPFTKQPMDRPIPEFLRGYLDLMSELLQELRATLPNAQA